jgi:hypothetical protein
MVLNDIHDIRLFWSTDKRFISQFEKGKDKEGPVQFQPFSRHTPHHLISSGFPYVTKIYRFGITKWPCMTMTSVIS